MRGGLFLLLLLLLLLADGFAQAGAFLQQWSRVQSPAACPLRDSSAGGRGAFLIVSFS